MGLFKLSILDYFASLSLSQKEVTALPFLRHPPVPFVSFWVFSHLLRPYGILKIRSRGAGLENFHRCWKIFIADTSYGILREMNSLYLNVAMKRQSGVLTDL